METCVFKGKCPRERKRGCDDECAIRPEIEFLLNNSNLPDGYVEKAVLYPENKDMEAFTTLDDIKHDIVNFVNDGRFVYLWSNSVGTGKAQPLDSLVYTKDGYKQMRDITIGTKVFGSDGKLHKVTGVYPQGMKDCYTVGFDDYNVCKGSAEHLWTFYDRENKEWVTKEFKDIDPKKWEYYEFPITKPLEYENNYVLEIEPYLLGFLLVRGYFESRKLSAYGIDPTELSRLVSKYDCGVTKHKAIYRITTNHMEKSSWKSENKVISALKHLGLYKVKRKDRFIPKSYLYNTVENRQELLNALIRFGSVFTGSDDNCVKVRSRKLAFDIKELAQSLGYTSDVRVYMKHYLVSINNNKVRHIVKRYSIGKKECQCIYIDSKDHLYLTDNMSVTHNTTWMIKLLKTYLAMMCIGNNFKPRAWFEYSPTFTLLTKEFDNESRQEHIDNLRERDLVIIDDIGSVNSSNYDLTILSSIIDYRYSHKKATLFTSNLSVDQLVSSLGARLTDRITSDIVIELKGGPQREYTNKYVPKGREK